MAERVSTATALVEGIYQGAARVSGTFEGLDGEMVVVHGHFFSGAP
jgi:alpha-acetolactate decarboxylase